MTAQFSTEQERKKWQSLQHQAGASLKKIVNGNATSSDFQRVTTALNQLNSLAATTFAHAVSAAEVQAKKFESAYESVLETRDNKTLTAYEAALNQALRTIEPNIVGVLQEIILNTGIETANEVDRTVGGRIKDLESLFPQGLATSDDLLASNDLLVEEIGKQDDIKWERREASLIEKIAGAFRDTLRDLADQINREREARNAPTAPSRGGFGGVPLLGHSGGALVPMHGFGGGGGGGHGAIDVEAHPVLPGAPNLLDKAMPLLGGPESQSGALAHAGQSGSTGTIVVSLSSHAEDKIIQAADAQTSLYQKLLDFLTSQSEGGGKSGGKEDDKEDEEDKADTWWRSFKNWYGSKIDSYKKFKKENGGWLKALGETLMLLVFNPQLFKTFGDMVKKWVTFDNVKSAVFAAWDWAANQASDMVDTVLDKLGVGKIDQKKVTDSKESGTDLSTTAPQAGRTDLNNLTPEQQKQMAAFDEANKDKHPGAVAKGDLKEGHQSWQSWVANLFGYTQGRESVVNSSLAHKDTNVNSPTYGQTVVNGQVVNGGRSTIDNSDHNMTIENTSVNSANGAAMTPGSTNPAPGSTGPEVAPGTGDNRAIKGAPQTGMSTFGFHTGIDDALMITNTPYFTG